MRKALKWTLVALSFVVVFASLTGCNAMIGGLRGLATDLEGMKQAEPRDGYTAHARR